MLMWKNIVLYDWWEGFILDYYDECDMYIIKIKVKVLFNIDIYV